MKYFNLFDLQPSLTLDESKLRRSYYELSKGTHPDYFTQMGKNVQEEKLEESSLLNDAYKTLKDRDSRIRYILKEKGMLEEGKQQVPQEFLMEMMDINEALMELEMDFDEKSYERSMNDIRAFEMALDSNFENIVTLWEEAKGGVIPDAVYEELKDYYLKNRYLLRIKENLSKFASR